MHYYAKDLFKDACDIAFALSTNGAQLTMKKQLDTWLVILMIFNLPPKIHYKSGEYITVFSNPPGSRVLCTATF